MKNKLKNYVDSKRDYLSEIEKIQKKDDFIYIIFFDNNIKIFQNEYIEYVKEIKDNLKNPRSLIEFNYELIPQNSLNKFTFGKTIFPLMVIKEKNKDIELIEGVRKKTLP